MAFEPSRERSHLRIVPRPKYEPGCRTEEAVCPSSGALNALLRSRIQVP